MINHNHPQPNPDTNLNPVTKENTPEAIPYEWIHQHQGENTNHEPEVIGIFKRNLQTFLYRADRIARASVNHTPRRALRAMSRLARLQIDKIERTVTTVAWEKLSPTEIALIRQANTNAQDAIVHIFGTIMPTGEEPRKNSLRRIAICTRTLKTKTPTRLNKDSLNAPCYSYGEIAEQQFLSYSEVRRIEKSALKKLRECLEPMQGTLDFDLSPNWQQHW